MKAEQKFPQQSQDSNFDKNLILPFQCYGIDVMFDRVQFRHVHWLTLYSNVQYRQCNLQNRGIFPTIVSLSAGIFARLFPQSQTLLWHSLIDKQAVLDDLNFVE